MNTNLINEFLKTGNRHELKVTANASGSKYLAQLFWDGQLFIGGEASSFTGALEALEAAMARLDAAGE